MTVSTVNVIEKLNKEDKEKVSYFINLLLSHSKYQKLKEEIAIRREEIRDGESFTHEEFWAELNV